GCAVPRRSRTSTTGPAAWARPCCSTRRWPRRSSSPWWTAPSPRRTPTRTADSGSAEEPRPLDGGAAVHDDVETRRERALRRRLVDDAQLQPHGSRAALDRLVDDGPRALGPAGHVDDVDAGVPPHVRAAALI